MAAGADADADDDAESCAPPAVAAVVDACPAAPAATTGGAQDPASASAPPAQAADSSSSSTLRPRPQIALHDGEAALNLTLVDPDRFGWTAAGGIVDLETPHQVRIFCAHVRVYNMSAMWRAYATGMELMIFYICSIYASAHTLFVSYLIIPHTKTTNNRGPDRPVPSRCICPTPSRRSKPPSSFGRNARPSGGKRSSGSAIEKGGRRGGGPRRPKRGRRRLRGERA